MIPTRLETLSKRTLFTSALCLVLASCGVRESGVVAPATPPVEAIPKEDRQIGSYKIGRPYQIDGVWYYPKVEYDYVETGIASWYGPGFHGKTTANGETYDQQALTAAHRTLPLPSMVRVTNLENGRTLMLRLNDRGPFKRGRIIDLSKRAADLLGVTRRGTARVKVEILERESRMLAAIAQGQTTPASKPQAAPTIAVAAVPLEPPSGPSSEPRGDAIGTLASELALESPIQAALAEYPTFLMASESADGTATFHRAPASRAEERSAGPPRPPGLWRHRRAMARARAAGAPVGVQLAALAEIQAAPDLLDGTGARERLDEADVPWPDGRVGYNPTDPSRLYVQAGSFLRRDYATRFSRRLAVHGRSAVTRAEVEGRWFFRVRIGPLKSVERADRILDALYQDGIKDARIVVD